MELKKFNELFYQASFILVSTRLDGEEEYIDAFSHANSVQIAANGENQNASANDCHIQTNPISYGNGNQESKWISPIEGKPGMFLRKNIERMSHSNEFNKNGCRIALTTWEMAIQKPHFPHRR